MCVDIYVFIHSGLVVTFQKIMTFCHNQSSVLSSFNDTMQIQYFENEWKFFKKFPNEL